MACDSLEVYAEWAERHPNDLLGDPKAVIKTLDNPRIFVPNEVIHKEFLSNWKERLLLANLWRVCNKDVDAQVRRSLDRLPLILETDRHLTRTLEYQSLAIELLDYVVQPAGPADFSASNNRDNGRSSNAAVEATKLEACLLALDESATSSSDNLGRLLQDLWATKYAVSEISSRLL